MKEDRENEFFDNKVKRTIEKKTNKSYDELEKWASDLWNKYKNGQKIAYLKSSSYESFYLFSIYRFKDTLEELWNKYYNYADKSFKLRMLDDKEKFLQYLWEMYLTIYLSDIPGMQIIRSKRDKGPDMELIYDNQTYYIECIAPTQGEKYDERGALSRNYLPSMKINFVGSLPVEALKQRLKLALKAKGEKYKEYIDNNKVSAKNNLGIAINTSCLSQYGSLMDFDGPILLKACEEMDFFEKYPFINFIMYSHKSIFDYNQMSLIILNNPKCKNSEVNKMIASKLLMQIDKKVYACKSCGKLVEKFPDSPTVFLGKDNDIVLVGEAPAMVGEKVINYGKM